MNFKNNKKWIAIKKNINNSLKLNTSKLTLISILLSLTLIFTLFETPPIFLNFLKIDFANVINLISILIIKLPYSLLIAIVVPWLKLILPRFIFGGNPEPIGEFAYMLSSINLLLIYSIFDWLFNKLFLFKDKKFNYWKTLIIKQIPIMILTCILVSLMNSFYNWAFILDLYGASNLKTKIWIIFFPFNLIKFILILFFHLLLIHPVQILIKKINI